MTASTKEYPEVGIVWLADFDPTTGGGVNAPLYQFLIRTDANQLYYKAGPADTAWSQLAGGGGGGGGVDIAAGTQTATSGTVKLANSNGVSFGMVGSSQITASVAQSAFVLSNSNNVSFGTNGSTVTATASFPAQTAFVLSNSNNVSFGTNGSTVTASASFAQTAFVLSNSNNVSFGTNGSTVTASASQTPFGISAGSQSVSTGTLVFSNSNGVTFGMSGSSRVTASFSSAPQYVSQFHNNSQSQSFGIVNALEYVVPVQCPFYISATALAIMLSASVNTSNAGTLSCSFGIYTLTQSTANLASSVLRAITWSAGNAAGTDDAAGMSGLRYRTIPGNFNLTPGVYLFAFHFRTSSDGTFTVIGNGGNQSIVGSEFNGGELALWLPGSINGGSSFTTAMLANFGVADTNYSRIGRQTFPAATLFGTY